MNSHLSRRAVLLGGSALWLVIVLAWFAFPVLAAPTAATWYYVTGNSDSVSSCTTRIPSGYNCSSLRSAVIAANANAGSTIVLTHGETYTLSIPPSGANDATTGNLNVTADMLFNFGNVICFSNCPATIQGGPGWNDNIFSIASGENVQIAGVIIQHGNISSTGGGIYNQGNLTLSGVTVITNTATSGGGGILNSGNLTMTGSAILSNTTTLNTSKGGGLYDFSGTTIISDSSIAYNRAPSGGGIEHANAILMLTNTTVTTNTATVNSGGGINAFGSVTITSGSINANTAVGSSGYGGGLNYNGSGSVVISGTDISTNQVISTGTGSGIAFANGSNLSLTNVTVNNNSGSCAVYLINGATLTITGGSINNNSGCGLYMIGGTNMTMTGSAVNGNTTSLATGGVYLEAATSAISSSSISTNTASFDLAKGGGIRLKSGALTVNNSTISGNNLPGTNAWGGGIYSESSAGLTVNASTISGNSAQIDGGMFVATPLTMTNSTISGNTARSIVGGISVSSGTASFSNVTLTGNQAPSSGGLSTNSGTTVTLKSTLIAGNIAPVDPDCNSGGLTSQGYNLLGIKSSSCGNLINGTNGDLVGTTGSPINPLLAPLGNYGGPTQTHALHFASPAINHIPFGTNGCGTTLTQDQRGVARPFNGLCDIGAFETTNINLFLPLIMR